MSTSQKELEKAHAYLERILGHIRAAGKPPHPDLLDTRIKAWAEAETQYQTTLEQKGKEHAYLLVTNLRHKRSAVECVIRDLSNTVLFQKRRDIDPRVGSERQIGEAAAKHSKAHRIQMIVWHDPKAFTPLERYVADAAILITGEVLRDIRTKWERAKDDFEELEGVGEAAKYKDAGRAD